MMYVCEHVITVNRVPVLCLCIMYNYGEVSRLFC